MPILSGPIQYTGSMDNLVAYKTRNSDKIILRRKPYITKDAYKREPQYAAMRRNSAEFAGCAYASKMIRTALSPLMRLADHNMAPALNRFAKAIQKQDTIHPAGERPILFSAHKHAFTAVAFTNRYLFDSVFKERPVAIINRERAEVQIQFSDLIPGFNFYLPWQKPYFRIIACLGAVEDLRYTANGYDALNKRREPVSVDGFSHWMPATQKMSAQNITLQLKDPARVQDSSITLLAGIGIQMGEPGVLGDIEPIKYACTARILAAL